jgi:hypothetical protein
MSGAFLLGAGGEAHISKPASAKLWRRAVKLRAMLCGGIFFIAAVSF